MANELVVTTKTEIAKQGTKKDILAIYNVPAMLDTIVEKERVDLLNKLNCGAVVADSLNKLAHSNDFIVEIPAGLRSMLKTGKATFDKSGKISGSFTPNIRIKGEAGIKGQATIVEKTDSQAVTQSLSNLAMMAMIQSVLEKLDALDEKIEDIKQGQKNDRIALIVGSFKSFIELYPTFEDRHEMNIAADSAYQTMQNGLLQLHLQIEQERNKLIGAPRNHWQTLWNSIIHHTRNDLGRYQRFYADYMYDLQLYNKLILLSDVILHLKGNDEVIKMNHIAMQEYCATYLDSEFRSTMKYIMNERVPELANIDLYNDNLTISLEGVMVSDLHIECKQQDVRYLNIESNESTNN